jgi:plastocyanin
VAELQVNTAAELDLDSTPQEQATRERNESMDDNLEAYWAQDYENCCIFVLHALEKANYDLDIVITMPNEQQVTVREAVLIHAPTFFKPAERKTSNYAKELKSGDAHYEAVFKGVVYALDASGQGSELVNVEEDGAVTSPKLEQLRPGDLFQWWTTSGHGHTTIVHRVKTADGHELDESSEPTAFQGARVVEVAVLGGHSSYRAHGTGGEAGSDTDVLTKEDQLYTTEFFSPGPTGSGGKTPRTGGGKSHELEKWWAVRPSGSRWNNTGS